MTDPSTWFLGLVALGMSVACGLHTLAWIERRRTLRAMRAAMRPHPPRAQGEGRDAVTYDRTLDIVARLALTIQRAGADHLGDVDTIHADLITLVEDWKLLRDENRRLKRALDAAEMELERKP